MKTKLTLILAADAILMSMLATVGASASDEPDSVLTPEARVAHETLVAESETYRPGDPSSVTTHYGISMTFTSTSTDSRTHSATTGGPYIPPVVTYECTNWRWSTGGTPYSYSAYRTCRLNNYPRPCIDLGGWSGGYRLNEYTDSWTESTGNYVFIYNEKVTQWDHFCLGEDFYRYDPETHGGRTFAPYG